MKVILNNLRLIWAIVLCVLGTIVYAEWSEPAGILLLVVSALNIVDRNNNITHIYLLREPQEEKQDEPA